MSREVAWSLQIAWEGELCEREILKGRMSSEVMTKYEMQSEAETSCCKGGKRRDPLPYI